jgi:hypothetical protein
MLLPPANWVQALCLGGAAVPAAALATRVSTFRVIGCHEFMVLELSSAENGKGRQLCPHVEYLYFAYCWAC